MKNLLIITQKVDKNDQLLGFFIDWIYRFAQKFDEIIVLCLEKGEFNLPDNVRVLSLGKDRGASKLKQLSTFYFLLSTIEYDAVFVHMNPIWTVLGGPWWRMMKKKIFFWYTSGGVTAKLKLAEKLADTIFTASSESFRLPSKKVIVTGHGIDTQLFQPSEKLKVKSEKLMILSVGRIAPVKNYEILVGAAKILADKGVDFNITLAGEPALEKDTEYQKNLKLKIENLKLTDRFNFVGKVDYKKLPQYYQSHDVFVHLSKTGSLDKALLEAMACGMWVLSSNYAAKTFLSPQFLFNEDNADDLAFKLKLISEGHYSMERDGSLRKHVVENNNLDNLINKIAKTINEQ